MKPHILPLVFAVILFFSCKKKDEPAPTINKAAFKLNGVQYVVDNPVLKFDNLGFANPQLIMPAGNATIYINFFSKGVQQQSLSFTGSTMDYNTVNCGINDGVAEISKYKPVDRGSVLSGSFNFTAFYDSSGVIKTLVVTDGTFVNIQSKDW